MLIKQNDKIFQLHAQGLEFVYCYGKGLALFSSREFRKDEVVISFEGGVVVSAEKSSKEAIQIDENNFLDTEYLVVEDFINHSCQPNTHCDIENRRFVAIKDIAVNEEITFNYCTTELDMQKYHSDFTCGCGAQSCYGKVKGFKYLTLRQQRALAPYLSPFLRTKLR